MPCAWLHDAMSRRKWQSGHLVVKSLGHVYLEMAVTRDMIGTLEECKLSQRLE